MDEDRPDLVRVVELSGFEEDDEVLLIHRGALYAVHGIVGYVDQENKHLRIDDRAKLSYDSMIIEGRGGMRIKVNGVDMHDPMALYEFLRDHRGYRPRSWYVFPGKGAWEAYKIVEKKPESQPAPAEPVAAEAVQENPLPEEGC